MPSIGETLRDARHKKGATEEAAAKAVKVKVERLRDLEENRYEHFPAYVYVRSFLRHYADYLGIDPKPLIQQFEETNPPPSQRPIFEIVEDQRFHCPIHRHVPSSEKTFSLTRTGTLSLMLLLALVILLLGVLFWYYRPSIQWSTHPQSSLPPAMNPSPSSDENKEAPKLIPPPVLPPATNNPTAR